MRVDMYRWLHRLANVGLVTAFLLALAPVGMRAYGHWSQAAQRRAFLQQRYQHRNAGAPPHVRAARWGWVPSLLQIPAIRVDAPVEEVDQSWFTVPGPGHDLESVGPGSPGNCIIGAHRNMWDSTFARLPNVKPGQTVRLVTDSRRYAYRVDWSREVTEEDTEALRDTQGPTVTLYTCMLPVSEGRRWVVHGHLISTD